MTDLSGKTGVVTGGAQGVGLGIARRLAQAGAGVLLADLQAEKVTAAAEALRAEGLAAQAFAGDVTQVGDVDALFARAASDFGPVDILVNNAGGSGQLGLATIADTDVEVWDTVIAANIRSTFLCSRAVFAGMAARRSGRIINISSGAARAWSGPLGTIGAKFPYVAGKAAVEAMTRQLAHDLAPYQATANAIVCGLVMTEPGARLHDRFSALDPAVQAQMLAHYNNDMATPVEVGELALYLASHAARQVNGQAIPIGMVA